MIPLIIFPLFAIGLAIAAVRVEGSTRWILLALCLLNVAGAAKALESAVPYYSTGDDNNYRRP